MQRMHRIVVLAVLVPCSGCSVMVQNRYSVFGFDAWQAATPEQAQAISLALLGGVAVASAALGAMVAWLVQRRAYRRVDRIGRSAVQFPAADHERSAERNEVSAA